MPREIGRVMVLALAIAAALIWAAFLYFSFRRITDGAEKGRESEIAFELEAAPWSDSHVESLLARNPNSPTLLRQYVTNAVERNDLEEASRRAGIFARRAPRSPDAWLARITVLRRMGREADAVALLREAVRRLPRNPPILILWANEAVRRKEWAEAARRFDRLRRRFPNDVHYRESMANALIADGRIDAAEAVIDEGMQLLPETRAMMEAAARVAERSGNREEGIRRWQALHRQFPDQPFSFVQLAEALARAGRGEEAAVLIRQAAEYFPGQKEVAESAARLAPPEEAAPPPPEAPV